MFKWLRSWTGIGLLILLIIGMMLERSSRLGFRTLSTTQQLDEVPLIPQVDFGLPAEVLEGLPKTGWGLVVDRDRGTLLVYKDGVFCGSFEGGCETSIGTFHIYFGERFRDVDSGVYSVEFIYINPDEPVQYEGKDGIWHSFHYWLGLSIPPEEKAQDGLVYALTEISSANEADVINGEWAAGTLPGTFLLSSRDLETLLDSSVIQEGLVVVVH